MSVYKKTKHFAITLISKYKNGFLMPQGLWKPCKCKVEEEEEDSMHPSHIQREKL